MAELTIGGVKIHVEVPLLFLFFGMILSDSVMTNLVIYRTCYVTLGYNESECALLGSKKGDNTTATLEKLVEPHASVVKLAHSTIEQGISIIICFFIGPWSDRFGRRLVLLIPLIGFFSHYIIMSIYSALPNLSPWYTLLCIIPVALTGGGTTYLTAVLSYITDVTNEENRGMRMGSFEAVLAFGILLGNISSSYVFYATHYWTVFLISALCCLIAFLFTLIFIPESLTEKETHGKIRGLFQASNVTEMIKTTFKKRRNFERCTVICCLVSLALYLSAIMGDGAVIFLYLRAKFQWSLEKYTLYSAAHNVTGIFGTLLGVGILHKLLKVPETIMILIGYLSMLNGSLMQALATRDYTIYAGAFVRCLGGALSPMVRSLVSKVVSNEEVGKIFSLIMAVESLCGLAASSIYTAIYNATINIDPSICMFVTAAIYGVEIIFAIVLILTRSVKYGENVVMYDELVNDVNNEEPSVSRVISAEIDGSTASVINNNNDNSTTHQS